MKGIEVRLLNTFQRGFPLEPRPYRAIGGQLGAMEAEITATLRQLCERGMISRVGATVVPGRLGAATLAAMAVPGERLEAVAALVNSYSEVNHNYERDGDYNLWFVVTAASEMGVRSVVRDIERRAACGRVLSLSVVEAYHLDLGFDLGAGESNPKRRTEPAPPAVTQPAPYVLSAAERALLVALQDGLPLVPRPYAELGTRAGMSEDAAIAALSHLLQARVIGRLGFIVRHRELGYRANAMVVWDVPNVAVRELGLNAARAKYVTLCYRRLRDHPEWPYNLYCMIHGTSRDVVSAQIAELNQDYGLARFPHAVLFSRRCFKQRGARYAEEKTHGRDRPIDCELDAERISRHRAAVPASG